MAGLCISLTEHIPLADNSLQTPQERSQRIDRQMRGVSRSLRQTANLGNQVFPAQPACCGNRLVLRQLRDCGTARHGRNAAFSKKADVSNSFPFQRQRELQNIAACGILKLRRGIGVRNFPRVPWALKIF
jgi:hypothetical protein